MSHNPGIRRGLEWKVTQVVLVPEKDKRGRQLYQPWNTRVPLQREVLVPLGSVYAEDRASALALAQAYHPDATVLVQSAASERAGRDDVAALKSRILRVKHVYAGRRMG